MIKPHQQKKPSELEQKLPLVLEVIPGQAREGLINIYEPGSYDNKSLNELVNNSLRKDNMSIEERQVVDDIQRQLDDGKLIYKGQEISSNPLDHAVVEETEAGEKYFYVGIRAIKPQEGGA